MTITLLFSISLTIGLFILSIIFKIAGKARLTLPLLYFLIAGFSTLFTDWVTLHENIVWIGFVVVLFLSITSWIVSLIHFIQDKRELNLIEEDTLWQITKARERGINVDTITFDSNGSLINPETGKPLF